MRYIFLVIFILSAITSAELIFYDDFSDNYIDDWTQRGLSGSWWASNELVHATTYNNWSGLSTPGEIVLQDCTVEIYGTATHALALFARLNEEDTGIYAVVSPDLDRARIRRVINGQASTVLANLSHNFPSGVWYDLKLTCEGDSISFEIYIPSTGEEFDIHALDPDPHPGECGMTTGDESHAQWDWFMISGTASPGSCTLHGLDTDDDDQGSSNGNGNWAFEESEKIELGIELLNQTSEDMENTFAVLQSLDSRLIVSEPVQQYGTIPSGDSRWNLSSYLVFASPGTPENETYPFRISIFADGGYNDYINFELPLGVGLFCDVESETSLWTVSLMEAGWYNNWHVTSMRNHTSDGSNSFKCGDTGAGDYDNLLFCSLNSPWFNFPLDGNLSFWIWIDTQIYSALDQGLAMDGSLVQLGQFDDWFTIEPFTGYPFEIVQPSSGPFEPGTGVFSGYQGWHLVNINIPIEIKGPRQLRFIFGSDNAGTREGWYVDDIQVIGSTGIEENHSRSGNLEPVLVYPNPFSESI